MGSLPCTIRCVGFVNHLLRHVRIVCRSHRHLFIEPTFGLA